MEDELRNTSSMTGFSGSVGTIAMVVVQVLDYFRLIRTFASA